MPKIKPKFFVTMLRSLLKLNSATRPSVNSSQPNNQICFRSSQVIQEKNYHRKRCVSLPRISGGSYVNPKHLDKQIESIKGIRPAIKYAEKDDEKKKNSFETYDEITRPITAPASARNNVSFDESTSYSEQPSKKLSKIIGYVSQLCNSKQNLKYLQPGSLQPYGSVQQIYYENVIKQGGAVKYPSEKDYSNDETNSTKSDRSICNVIQGKENFQHRLGYSTYGPTRERKLKNEVQQQKKNSTIQISNKSNYFKFLNETSSEKTKERPMTINEKCSDYKIGHRKSLSDVTQPITEKSKVRKKQKKLQKKLSVVSKLTADNKKISSDDVRSITSSKLIKSKTSKVSFKSNMATDHKKSNYLNQRLSVPWSSYSENIQNKNIENVENSNDIIDEIIPESRKSTIESESVFNYEPLQTNIAENLKPNSLLLKSLLKRKTSLIVRRHYSWSNKCIKKKKKVIRMKVPPCVPRTPPCPTEPLCLRDEPVVPKRLPKICDSDCDPICPVIPPPPPKLKRLNMSFTDPKKLVCQPPIPDCQPRADDGLAICPKQLPPISMGDCKCINPIPMKDVALPRLKRAIIKVPERVPPIEEECVRKEVPVVRKRLPVHCPPPCPPIKQPPPSISPKLKQLKYDYPDPKRITRIEVECDPSMRADGEIVVCPKKLPPYVSSPECLCINPPRMKDIPLKRLKEVCEDPEEFDPLDCCEWPRADDGCWEYYSPDSTTAEDCCNERHNPTRRKYSTLSSFQNLDVTSEQNGGNILKKFNNSISLLGKSSLLSPIMETKRSFGTRPKKKKCLQRRIDSCPPKFCAPERQMDPIRVSPPYPSFSELIQPTVHPITKQLKQYCNKKKCKESCKLKSQFLAKRPSFNTARKYFSSLNSRDDFLMKRSPIFSTYGFCKWNDSCKSRPTEENEHRQFKVLDAQQNSKTSSIKTESCESKKINPPYPAYSDCLSAELQEVLSKSPIIRELAHQLQPKYKLLKYETDSVKSKFPEQETLDVLKEEECIKATLDLPKLGLSLNKNLQSPVKSLRMKETRLRICDPYKHKKGSRSYSHLSIADHSLASYYFPLIIDRINVHPFLNQQNFLTPSSIMMSKKIGNGKNTLFLTGTTQQFSSLSGNRIIHNKNTSSNAAPTLRIYNVIHKLTKNQVRHYCSKKRSISKRLSLRNLFKSSGSKKKKSGKSKKKSSSDENSTACENFGIADEKLIAENPCCMPLTKKKSKTAVSKKYLRKAVGPECPPAVNINVRKSYTLECNNTYSKELPQKCSKDSCKSVKEAQALCMPPPRRSIELCPKQKPLLCPVESKSQLLCAEEEKQLCPECPPPMSDICQETEEKDPCAPPIKKRPINEPCSAFPEAVCADRPPSLSLWARIVKYFRAREGCPTAEELRQQRLLKKAEQAAKAAGMCLIDPKCLPADQVVAMGCPDDPCKKSGKPDRKVRRCKIKDPCNRKPPKGKKKPCNLRPFSSLVFSRDYSSQGDNSGKVDDDVEKVMRKILATFKEGMEILEQRGYITPEDPHYNVYKKLEKLSLDEFSKVIWQQSQLDEHVEDYEEEKYKPILYACELVPEIINNQCKKTNCKDVNIEESEIADNKVLVAAFQELCNKIEVVQKEGDDNSGTSVLDELDNLLKLD